VIGGGFAGCAAAVELAQAGYHVTLYEAGANLGGRARTVVRDGLALDNGQHLLLGAYRETRRIAEIVRGGVDDDPWLLSPLAIRPFGTHSDAAVSFKTRTLPAGLGLIAGIATSSGLSWRERLGLVRWFARQRRRHFRCDPDLTVASLLEDLPARPRNALLAPLCLAALNTPIERASAQIFLNVLREAFVGALDASSIAVPHDPLGDTVPERTASWLTQRGHSVRRSARVTVTSQELRGVSIRVDGVDNGFEAAIVAVGPHQFGGTFDARLVGDSAVAAALSQVQRFEWEAITTIYLGYLEPLQLGPGLLRLDDAPGQWLFDRGDILRRSGKAADERRLRALIAVVISAHQASSEGSVALVRDVEHQLRRLSPAMPCAQWTQVIAEKRATYACSPTLARPSCGRLTSGLYLAGDYTYEAFPATLEAAVRSGVEAARALVHDLDTADAASRATSPAFAG
jgi:squalene-associated FAD-dependent desaturase